MKHLNKFPREISAKFCYGLEFHDDIFDDGPEKQPQQKENNDNINDLVRKFHRPLKSNEEMRAEAEDARERERIEAELLNETTENINVTTNLEDSGLASAENRDTAVAYDVASSQSFDYNQALQETNNLLANLEQEMQNRNFGNFDSYDV